jgi:UDPglucose 6-dehydrogenase
MMTPEGAPTVHESPDEPLHVLMVGAGVVGQAEGSSLRALGHDVVFADVDDAVLSRCRSEGFRTVPMSDLLLVGTDVLLVSVPTPTTDGACDLRQLEQAMATIGDALGRAWHSEPGRYRVVIVRSTVPPGTTESIIIPLLEAEAGLRPGAEFGVSVCPEFLRQRRAVEDALAPRLIVIGQLDDRSGDVTERLNAGFGAPMYRTRIPEAEFLKYVHNLFNASKISLFNELRQVAVAIGVDAERVFSLVTQSAEASWNPAYGTLDLGPVGGPCLPKDLEAFLTWARRHGLELPILSAVERSSHPAKAR